jgi:hypothetical protein
MFALCKLMYANIGSALNGWSDEDAGLRRERGRGLKKRVRSACQSAKHRKDNVTYGADDLKLFRRGSQDLVLRRVAG